MPRAPFPVRRCRPVLLALALALGGLQAAAQDLTVHAAASLRGALDEVAALWQAETGGRLTLVYAGSSALARQIAAGAPGDVFISANAAWMDLLEEGGHLAPGGRADLLTNALVVIAPAGEDAPLDLSALPERLGAGRLALALTEAVPAGIYARQALVTLGLWERVAPRVVEADNVRAALALVASGAAPIGIVYATDAIAEPRVAVLAEVPAEAHDPIVYPAAALAGGDAEGSAALLALMRGEAAGDVFRRHGFGLVGGD
ncbi:molybdate ABC transporter substrate-binding protein [Rhodobacterales bacterium HKCCSP123]|nr:molybdate ABC transporter substrate-binding protein [Rhodobacterales bacterium HKCCSP123]